MKQEIQNPPPIGPEASASAAKITATESDSLRQELCATKKSPA
jgi:hypothetical protein